MYRFLISLIFSFILITVKAQINIKPDNIPATSEPIKVKYDSLTNISKFIVDSVKFVSSYKHLIGQKIYYVGVDSLFSDVGEYFYKTFEDAKDGSYFFRNEFRQQDFKNRYFYIEDIDDKNAIFTLKDVDNGTIMFLRSWHPNRDMVILGYYEKMKQLYVGKTFVYKDVHMIGEIKDYNRLINFRTNEANKEIPEETQWRCVDIAIYSVTKLGLRYEERCPVILVFENDKYGKYYSYIQDEVGRDLAGTFAEYYDNETHDIPLFLAKFVDMKKNNFLLKKNKEFRQNLVAEKRKMIAKYGKYWGAAVADGELKIGMTKQMCRDSWGEPDEINRTITKYGSHEQWVYGSGTFIYFDNDKISALQD